MFKIIFTIFILQYVFICIFYMLNVYKSKKDLSRDMIPFYWLGFLLKQIVISSIKIWKGLK
jgi:hypothetical protein